MKMTIKDFIQQIQAYYGLAYPEGMRKPVYQCLVAHQDHLQDLFDMTTMTLSTVFKQLPDPVKFEEAYQAMVAKKKKELAMNDITYRKYYPEEIDENVVPPEQVQTTLKKLRERYPVIIRLPEPERPVEREGGRG